MKRVCVYCGSSLGKADVYKEAAAALGRELVRRGVELVYGGAKVGLMGVIADAMLNEGGTVIGVMPESLMKKEIAHEGLTELHVTSTMHERKTLMAELGDGFVAMPGGAGTLEELFEVWTWGQLRFHNKPCGLLNVSGYFDHLVRFLQHSADEAFVRQTHVDMLIVEENPGRLLDRFESYKAPVVEKWI